MLAYVENDETMVTNVLYRVRAHHQLSNGRRARNEADRVTSTPCP